MHLFYTRDNLKAPGLFIEQNGGVFMERAFQVSLGCILMGRHVTALNTAGIAVNTAGHVSGHPLHRVNIGACISPPAAFTNQFFP